MNQFKPRLVNPTVTVSLTTANARSAQLSPGWHRVWCDVAVFLRQGGSAVAAATATGSPLGATQETYIFVQTSKATADSDCYLAGILSAGTGTLYITRQ